MKAWRKAAAAAKAEAINAGTHQRGQRYGRLIRNVTGRTTVRVLPPLLLIALAYRAGHIPPMLIQGPQQ